jgi:hypothetical protein
MLHELRHAWLELQAAEPGRRFRDRYRRRTNEKKGGVRKPLIMAAGIGLITVGLVGMVAPGPGVIGIALGAALVAQESYAAATLLDELELQGRKMADAALARWRGLSPGARAALVLVAAAIVLVAAFALYRLVF